MSSLTRDQFAARLQINLNDAGYYYTSADFNSSLQDGYDEIAALSGCIMKAVSIPYVANKSYYDMLSLVPDYLCVVAIFSDLRKRWLSPTSFKELNVLRYNWELANGDPLAFFPVNFRYIAIFPRPAAVASGQNFYIFYKAMAPIMAGGDIPLFPPEYNKVLEAYSTMDLMEQQNEFSKASVYSKPYVEGLEELRVWVKEQRLPDRIVGLKNN